MSETNSPVTMRNAIYQIIRDTYAKNEPDNYRAARWSDGMAALLTDDVMAIIAFHLYYSPVSEDLLLDGIREYLWINYPGGTTAGVAANKILKALDKRGNK